MRVLINGFGDPVLVVELDDAFHRTHVGEIRDPQGQKSGKTVAMSSSREIRVIISNEVTKEEASLVLKEMSERVLTLKELKGLI